MSTADENGMDLDALLKLPADELDAQMFASSSQDDGTTIEGGARVVATTDTDPKGDTTTVESSAAPAAAAVEEVQPEGVLAKDGKHLLPFTVVEDLRNSKADLERVVREQNEQIESLKQAKASGVVDTDVLKDQELLSEEQLAELEEEMPALAKTLRSQQASLVSLLTERATEKQKREHDEQQRDIAKREATRTSVQEAIDATPLMSHLQSIAAENPVLFERAKTIDREFLNNPRLAAHFANKTLAERFAAVSEEYEARYGKVAIPSLPATPSPAPTPAPAAKPTPKPAPAGPLSLSDLPGGASPAADSRAEMAGRSGVEIASQMANWSTAQLDAYYANL